MLTSLFPHCSTATSDHLDVQVEHFLGLTVDIPLGVPGGDVENLVDALEDRLELLLLSDLRLRDLGHVQLLSLQLL